MHLIVGQSCCCWFFFFGTNLVMDVVMVGDGVVVVLV